MPPYRNMPSESTCGCGCCSGVLRSDHLLHTGTPPWLLDRAGNRGEGSIEGHVRGIACIDAPGVPGELVEEAIVSQISRTYLQCPSILWTFEISGTRSCARASPLIRVTPSTNSCCVTAPSPSSRSSKSVVASEVSMPKSLNQYCTLGCEHRSVSSSKESAPSPEVSASSKRAARSFFNRRFFVARCAVMMSWSRATWFIVSLKKSAEIILVMPKITKLTYTAKKAAYRAFTSFTTLLAKFGQQPLNVISKTV
mmetsp:Transcript_136493/g.265506  ORF Transcript_136493/g.265506 Transcript_136493/m.265506 type:complete len:253 (+) Transcript_136493:240-998(+)